MNKYKVAFELIDSPMTVMATEPQEAVYTAIEEIPPHSQHRSPGGVEVVDESGEAHWFEPVMKYVGKPVYPPEPILDHVE